MLFCNFQFFYNSFYNQEQKHVDWANEEGKKKTVMLAADPNVRMPTSVFPNDIINIILLENQIIKSFGKIKTSSEDKASYPAELKQRPMPGFKQPPRPGWVHHISVCPAERKSPGKPQTPPEWPVRKDRLRKKGLESMQRSPWDSALPTTALLS